MTFACDHCNLDVGRHLVPAGSGVPTHSENVTRIDRSISVKEAVSLEGTSVDSLASLQRCKVLRYCWGGEPLWLQELVVG